MLRKEDARKTIDPMLRATVHKFKKQESIQPNDERWGFARIILAIGLPRILHGAASGNAVKESGSRIRENSGLFRYSPKSHDFGYDCNRAFDGERSP